MAVGGDDVGHSLPYYLLRNLFAGAPKYAEKAQRIYLHQDAQSYEIAETFYIRCYFPVPLGMCKITVTPLR